MKTTFFSAFTKCTVASRGMQPFHQRHLNVVTALSCESESCHSHVYEGLLQLEEAMVNKRMIQ